MIPTTGRQIHRERQGSPLRRFLAGSIGVPLWDRSQHLSIRDSLKLLERAWSWSRKEIEEYRNSRLRSLIQHCYDRIPFYASRMRDSGVSPSDIGSTGGLSMLPVLDRDDLAPLMDSVNSTLERTSGIHAGSSSGSTGKPVSFLKDSGSTSMGIAGMFFGWRRAGWDFGDTYARIWGNPATVNEKWTSWQSRLKAFMLSERRIAACDLTDRASISEALRKLKSWKPRYLEGYSNSLYAMASVAEEENTGLPVFEGVFTTAETLFPHQREVLERVFGKVSDQYGSSEVNSIAFQCSFCGEYHIVAPHVIVEFEDAGLGRERSIIVTDLDNYVMPLVRYRLGDLVVPSDSPERCSACVSWDRITSVTGRVSQVIRIGESGFMNPITYFGDSLGRMLRQKAPQVRQHLTSWDGIEFVTRIVSPQPISEESLEAISSEMQSLLDKFEVRHRFQVEKRIDGHSQGKGRFFLDLTGDDPCGS